MTSSGHVRSWSARLLLQHPSSGQVNLLQLPRSYWPGKGTASPNDVDPSLIGQFTVLASLDENIALLRAFVHNTTSHKLIELQIALRI